VGLLGEEGVIIEVIACLLLSYLLKNSSEVGENYWVTKESSLEYFFSLKTS